MLPTYEHWVVRRMIYFALGRMTQFVLGDPFFSPMFQIIMKNPALKTARLPGKIFIFVEEIHTDIGIVTIVVACCLHNPPQTELKTSKSHEHPP